MKKTIAFIVLLVSMNSPAVIRVDVVGVDGRVHIGIKDTQEEADTWKAENITTNSWGKKQRWEKYIAQTDCLQFRDIVEMVLVDEILTPTVVGADCERPVEYTITQTDITVEVQAAKDKKEADDLKRAELIEIAKLRPLTQLEMSDWIKMQMGI